MMKDRLGFVSGNRVLDIKGIRTLEWKSMKEKMG